MSDRINIDPSFAGNYDDSNVVENDINLNEDYTINWDNPTQPEEDAIQEQEATEVPLGEQTESSEEVADEVWESEEGEYDDEVSEEDVEEALEDDDDDYTVELGQIQNDEADDYDEEHDEEDYDEDYDDEDDDLYEGDEWDALFDFIEDNPGATPEDYFALKDFGEGLSDEQKIKLHLANANDLDVEDDADEIDFLYEDQFSYDEDLDSERDIKLRKIAQKKALREANAEIDELRETYGGDVSYTGNLPDDVKEAVSFYEEHQESLGQQQELANSFQERTQDYFTNEFKGFEFEYGDGRSQRIKVGNNSKVGEEQSDISNFINKYIGEDGQIEDLGGYHKALWAANNVDALFNHAYEQGKADAVRGAAKSAKNIDMGARQESAPATNQQGKFKLLDHEDETDFRFNF